MEAATSYYPKWKKVKAVFSLWNWHISINTHHPVVMVMVMGLMARSSQDKERQQDSNASICFCERHLQYITSRISVDDSWTRQVRTIHEGLQPVPRKEAGYIRMAWSSPCHIACYLLPIVVLRPWLVCCMHILLTWTSRDDHEQQQPPVWLALAVEVALMNV